MNTRIIGTLLGAIAVVLLLLQLRKKDEEPAQAPAVTAAPAVAAHAGTGSPAGTAGGDAALEAEREARRKAEAETARLRAQIAPLQGEVVVSLGKVTDMGRKAGTVLPALQEMRALSRKDRDTLTEDEKKRLLTLQRQQVEVLGMLPEIAGFQNNPSEYASFYRSMIQAATGIDDTQAARVETWMLERGQGIIAQGLNNAKKPNDEAQEEQWEEKRDEFNEKTAEGLQSLLPDGVAARAGINTQLLELMEMDFDKAGENAP